VSASFACSKNGWHARGLAARLGGLTAIDGAVPGWDQPGHTREGYAHDNPETEVVSRHAGSGHPSYERIVADRQADAQAMVVLANAYWLTGRGPGPVEALAVRAKEIDPMNRGACICGRSPNPTCENASSGGSPSPRVPSDQLARAALADNATSLRMTSKIRLRSSSRSPRMRVLLAEAPGTAQRLALEQSLKTLRGWKL